MGLQISTWFVLVLWMTSALEGFLTGSPRDDATTSNQSQRQGSSRPLSFRGEPRRTQKNLLVDYPLSHGSTQSWARLVPEWWCHTLAESASLPLEELEMVVLDLPILLEELSPEEPPREDWVLEPPWSPLAMAPLPGGFRLEDSMLSLPHWADAMLFSPPSRGQAPSMDACSLVPLVSVRGGPPSSRHPPLQSVGGLPPCWAPSVHPLPLAPRLGLSLLAPLQALRMTSA